MTGDPTPAIIIAEIEKSARETIRVALTAYKGTPTLSIWVWYRTASGELRPGKAAWSSGFAISLRSRRPWRRRW